MRQFACALSTPQPELKLNLAWGDSPEIAALKAFTRQVGRPDQADAERWLEEQQAMGNLIEIKEIHP
jgi:hypothetical protein